MNETRTHIHCAKYLPLVVVGIALLLTTALHVYAEPPTSPTKPFTVAIVDDFTELDSSPALTPELLEQLLRICGGKRVVKLVYTVVAEKAEAAPVPLDLTPPPALKLPELPDPKLPLRQFEEQSRVFMQGAGAARKARAEWLQKQKAELDMLKMGVLDSQVRTEGRFLVELEKRGGKDYRRSAVAAAVKLVCSASPDVLILCTDGIDLPANGPAQKTPVKEIPAQTRLILLHPNAVQSPLFAVPNAKITCLSLSDALVRVSELIATPVENTPAR